MEPFASNRLTDNSGSFLIEVMDGKALPAFLCPKRHPHGTLGSKESSTETPGLGNPNSSQVAHLLQDHRLLPCKANHHVQLHLTSLLELLTWSTHWDGFSLNLAPKLSDFALLCVLVSPALRDPPSSWPWSACTLSDTLPQAGNNRPWGTLRTEELRRSYLQLRIFWPTAQALFRLPMFFRIFSLHH